MSRQAEKERHKWGVEQGRQELYGALAQGLQGLQRTLRDSEEVQRARTTRCLQLLAQEIRDRWASSGGQVGDGCGVGEAQGEGTEGGMRRVGEA